MISVQSLEFRVALIGLATLLALGVGATGTSALGAEKTVTEEVLEILKASGTISEDKYEELLERAQSEQAEREAAAASKLPDQTAKEKDPKGWTVKWSNGTKVERNDGAFKLKIGGRAMLDFAQIWGDQSLRTSVNDNGAFGSGVECRRCRLFVQGTLNDRLLFNLQVDFAGNSSGGGTALKDAYMGLTGLGPVGTVRIGHMKEDFSLEEMTSSKYIVFMERALPSVFDPERNVGISAYNTFLDGRLRYALGGFHQTNDGAFGQKDTPGPTTYHITGRLTGLPYWEDKGKKFMHLGIDYSHQFTGSGGTNDLDYAQDPEAHLAADYVDTANIQNVEAIDLFTGEIAAGWNSLSAQAEWQGSLVSRRGNQEDLFFWGVYGQLSWFATGEHRNYSPKYGNFGRTKLKKNFDPTAGTWGAFELAARVSYLDLNSHDVRGGELFDITAGVNWYLWPNVRIMTNYVHSILRQGLPTPSGGLLAPGKGDGDLFEMRFQLDF